MPTVGVFAAVFDDQRRLLFIKHDYGPKNWSTPGGRMEAGESPTLALQREVREETGFAEVVVVFSDDGQTVAWESGASSPDTAEWLASGWR